MLDILILIALVLVGLGLLRVGLGLAGDAITTVNRVFEGRAARAKRETLERNRVACAAQRWAHELDHSDV